MKTLTTRTVDLFAFLFCCALIAIALYLQIHVKLEPCPLCILQRIVVMGLGLLFAVGALLNLHGTPRRIYHLFIFVIAIVGIVLAGRHVWLEYYPPAIPATCGADLGYLFHVLPANQLIQLVFQGSGDCSKVTWRFLDLSIPMWTLGCFIFLALLALWQACKSRE